MFNITILSVGSVKTGYLQEAVGEYLKRLKPYAKISLVELVAESFSSGQKAAAKRKEGKKIEEYLARRTEARIFLLDEKGKEWNSVEMAQNLDQINQPIVFVLGGSLGLENGLLERYPRLALSRLTFLHEMAKVLLLEQIYRSVAIIKGKDYHY